MWSQDKHNRNVYCNYVHGSIAHLSSHFNFLLKGQMQLSDWLNPSQVWSTAHLMHHDDITAMNHRNASQVTTYHYLPEQGCVHHHCRSPHPQSCVLPAPAPELVRSCLLRCLHVNNTQNIQKLKLHAQATASFTTPKFDIAKCTPANGATTVACSPCPSLP